MPRLPSPYAKSYRCYQLGLIGYRNRNPLHIAPPLPTVVPCQYIHLCCPPHQQLHHQKLGNKSSNPVIAGKGGHSADPMAATPRGGEMRGESRIGGSGVRKGRSRTPPNAWGEFTNNLDAWRLLLALRVAGLRWVVLLPLRTVNQSKIRSPSSACKESEVVGFVCLPPASPPLLPPPPALPSRRLFTLSPTLPMLGPSALIGTISRISADSALSLLVNSFPPPFLAPLLGRFPRPPPLAPLPPPPFLPLPLPKILFIYNFKGVGGLSIPS